jgi:copper chaperone NosL
LTISNDRCAAELITSKGRFYKFDDYACMNNYMAENDKTAGSRTYVSDYISPGRLIGVQSATFIEGESLGSPMGGNMAAFSSKDSAEAYAQRLGAVISRNN